jgi:hypothetical protein
MTTLTGVEQHQDLASLVHLYLLRCQVEGKSPNTITAYRETPAIFQGIAREDGFPEDVRAITPAHIYAYLGRIGSNGANLGTRHRKPSTVRGQDTAVSGLQRVEALSGPLRRSVLQGADGCANAEARRRAQTCDGGRGRAEDVLVRLPGGHYRRADRRTGVAHGGRGCDGKAVRPTLRRSRSCNPTRASSRRSMSRVS